MQGCVGVNTFPTITRPNDTVSVMIGGVENASKDTIEVSLTDVATTYDLQSLGLVRSVFNLRPDGRAYGMHYPSFYADLENPWVAGHEPTQAVLVVDIPAGATPGPATLTVNHNSADEDSSGISSPYTIALEIIDGAGTSTEFLRQDFSGSTPPVSFEDLEPAPHAKVSFGKGGFGGGLGDTTLAAISMIVDFDGVVVNGDDLNVYVAESTVRGTLSNQSAPFGDKQRMVAWRQDGSQLYIDIIAPYGIDGRYLQIYIMHPRGIVGDPSFSLTSTNFWDLDGNPVTFGNSPTLTYSP
jgi:hypothetical protein